MIGRHRHPLMLFPNLLQYSVMVMFALPTWGVALHGRGLQKQYRLLQQQRITAKAADSGATGEACTGSSSSCGLGSKQRTDSILSRFKAEALHRSASAPGRLGTGACTEDQPAHDKTPDSVAPRDVGLPAAQVPHMAAGPSSSAEAAPAAAVDQSLQLVMAAPPLVVLDGASSSQGQELAAAASMWAPPFPAPSTAAGSNSSGDSSNDHVQQEQGSMSRVSVGSAPPATTATAAVAAVPPLMLDALGAAEEAPDDDVDIAAIRDSLQPRLAALLGPELGEQLLSNLGVERPAGVPHYTSKVEVIPVSCKVIVPDDGPAHDYVAQKLTSAVHNFFQDAPGAVTAGGGAASGVSAAPGPTFGFSRPWFMSSICIEGCVQLVGSMFAFRGAGDSSDPAADGAAPPGTVSSQQGGTAGNDGDTSQPALGRRVSAVLVQPSTARRLLSTVLSSLGAGPASTSECQLAGSQVSETSSAMAEAPEAFAWVGDHKACSNSSLVNKQVVTHPGGATPLHLVSTYPICVTAGATSTLRLHLQGAFNETQRRQQQAGAHDTHLEVDQVHVTGRVRLVAHMQGRLLVDKEVALEDAISLELPELPVGILEVALLCVTTHRPLVTTPMLVLPAPAAEDLEQVWAAHLATGMADIDSAMAVERSIGLSDVTGQVWSRQMLPLVVDMCTLLLATSSVGQARVVLDTAAAAAAPAAGRKQLQSNHGAVSGAANMEGAVCHLAANLLHYLARMNAYSLAELVTMRVAALQEAVGKAAAAGVDSPSQATGTTAAATSASASAAATPAGAVPEGEAAAEGEAAQGAAAACCTQDIQVPDSQADDAGGSPERMPEPATPPARLQRPKVLDASPHSSSINSSGGSGMGACPLLWPRVSWEPVRVADACIAMQALRLALFVLLEEVPSGLGTVAGVAVLAGWHLVLLGPTLVLLVRKQPLVGWRRDIFCMGWAAATAAYIAVAARLGLLPGSLLFPGAALNPWGRAFLALVFHGIWRPLVTQAAPPCCILINLLQSSAAVYAHACMGASWSVVRQLMVTQVLTAVAGPLITHWVVGRALRMQP